MARCVTSVLLLHLGIGNCWTSVRDLIGHGWDGSSAGYVSHLVHIWFRTRHVALSEYRNWWRDTDSKYGLVVFNPISRLGERVHFESILLHVGQITFYLTSRKFSLHFFKWHFTSCLYSTGMSWNYSPFRILEWYNLLHKQRVWKILKRPTCIFVTTMEYEWWICVVQWISSIQLHKWWT